MSVGPGSETHCICRSFIFVFIVQDATCTILKGHLASVKIALRERCCAQIETVGGSKNSGMENGASQQSRNCIAMGRLLSFSDLQKKNLGNFNSYNFSGFNTLFEAILSVLQRE